MRFWTVLVVPCGQLPKVFAAVAAWPLLPSSASTSLRVGPVVPGIGMGVPRCCLAVDVDAQPIDTPGLREHLRRARFEVWSLDGASDHTSVVLVGPDDVELEIDVSVLEHLAGSVGFDIGSIGRWAEFGVEDSGTLYGQSYALHDSPDPGLKVPALPPSQDAPELSLAAPGGFAAFEHLLALRNTLFTVRLTLRKALLEGMAAGAVEPRDARRYADTLGDPVLQEQAALLEEGSEAP